MVEIKNHIPNLISFIRILLAFFVIWMIPSLISTLQIALGFLLIIVAFGIDALDGYLARKWNISSTFGSFVDVFGDRLMEIIFWIFFFFEGMIHPAWVLIFFFRIFLTDILKIYTFLIGDTDSRGPIIKGFMERLVLSKRSRGGYLTLKISLFCYLFLEYTGVWSIPTLKHFLLASTVILCMVRGSPVIISYLPRFLMDIIHKNYFIINYSLLKLHFFKRTLKLLIFLLIQMLTEVFAIGLIINSIVSSIIK